MQYGPLADNFENQIDRFSAHIEQRLQPNILSRKQQPQLNRFRW
jgi:hypothetical protein